MVNKTQDVTLATVWDGLPPLQDTVTPSPVDTIEVDIRVDESEDGSYANITVERVEKVDPSKENGGLKSDVPHVDKFVRAGIVTRKFRNLFQLYCILFVCCSLA